MTEKFQMISSNAGFFGPPSVELRTTEMPKLFVGSLGYRYESCLFSVDDSEVLARYDTLSEAVQGHVDLARKHKLGTQVK